MRIIERKIDAAKSPIVGDGHNFGFEPVTEMNNIYRAKNDRGRDENPGFFIHTLLNVTATWTVEPSC